MEQFQIRKIISSFKYFKEQEMNEFWHKCNGNIKFCLAYFKIQYNQTSRNFTQTKILSQPQFHPNFICSWSCHENDCSHPNAWLIPVKKGIYPELCHTKCLVGVLFIVGQESALRILLFRIRLVYNFLSQPKINYHYNQTCLVT